MKSYEVFLSQPAINDLKEIHDYLVDVLKEPAAGEKLVEKPILPPTFSQSGRSDEDL